MTEPINPIDRGKGSEPGNQGYEPPQQQQSHEPPPQQQQSYQPPQNQTGFQSQGMQQFNPGQQLQPGMLSPDEKTMAMLLHILVLANFITGFLGTVGTLVLWLIKKDESQFIDYHGKEALNFQITIFIAAIISFVLIFVLIGFFLLLALLITNIVLSIMAGIAANNGEYYQYPFSIRIIK